MGHNVCKICGAKNGRAGYVISTEKYKEQACQNCNDTRETGNITIHSHLIRTDEEIELMIKKLIK